MEIPQEFISLDYLTTFAGMVVVVYIITRFFKEMIKKHFPDWSVRLFVLLVAFIIQGFVLGVTNNFTLEAIGLGIINSFIVALTAIGAYNALSDPKAEK